MSRTVRILASAVAAFLCMEVSVRADQQGVTLSGSCGSPYSVQFILRQDFNDVPILGCNSEVPIAAAIGARASYSYDDIHKSSGFSVDGLAALNIVYSAPEIDFLSNISFGPFLQGSAMRTPAYGSTPASTNASDTAGAFVQTYVDQVVEVRLRGGELTDNTGVRDGSATAEFIPVFQLSSLLTGKSYVEGDAPIDEIGKFVFGSGYPVANIVGLANPLSHLIFVFAPEFEAQYDRYQGGPRSFGLFATNQEAMRLGPLIVFKLYGFGSLSDQPIVHDVLASAFVSLTYHADWDALSQKRYYNFMPALILNLNPAGTAAVTTSYSMGDSEMSGNRMRQLKVALSLKF